MGPLVPLLSAEACEQIGLLQMIFDLYEENLILKFPEVFEGLDCLPGSDEIVTDLSILPVKHMPRKVPVFIKARLKEEIDRLVELQVIAPVKEPTDWISSMICVKKNLTNYEFVLIKKILIKQLSDQITRFQTLTIF